MSDLYDLIKIILDLYILFVMKQYYLPSRCIGPSYGSVTWYIALNIPKLNVTAIVRRLGTTPSGEMVTPDNVYDAGWYQGSSRPGQPGAMVLDGHISSWTTHGIFYGLNTLRPGDAIHITRGDGSIVTYLVSKSITYNADQVDMAAVFAPVAKNRPGLNLVSCTGDVVAGTNEFDKRIVIFATLAS